jgi:hypothetical protein
MTPHTCQFEEQVLAAVASGDWPDRADQALRAHVTECATCADLAIVGGLLRDDHAAAVAESNVPSSGQVWWRTQVRARAEAQRAAARPIFIAQAIGAAALVGLIAAVISWVWPKMPAAAGLLHAAGAPTELGTVAWLAIGAWVILAPVALYFVFARE